MSIEAMKLALEALEEPKEHFAKHRRLEAVIALRAAIKQAKPWVKTYANGEPQYTTPEEQPERDDGVCRHCNGAGCVACDARHLPKQEPVAWMHNFIEGNVITHRPADIDRHPERWTALYTTQPRRENT